MDESMHDKQPPSVTAASPPPEKPKGKPKTLKCPACAGTITVKAVGITINAVCSSCSSVIDITNENYQIIEKANQNTRKTLLDIGCRGRLSGVEWEVIGYIEKTDASGKYNWDEYLLYNPYYGFRFLVQDSGHWNFVKVLRQDVPGAGISSEILFEGQKFARFLTGEAIVSYVKGEFYWRVKKGERTFVADYIAPPRMLSFEKTDQEISVSLGEYIENDVVVDAFAVKGKMPYKTGVAPNQPAPDQAWFGKLWRVAATAFAIVLAVQFTTCAIADNTEVYHEQIEVSPQQKDQTITTASFNISKAGNVLIQSSSPIQNDWVELDMSLVNDRTNEQYELKQAIEYYQGHDGGEDWTEGSTSANTYISRVPAGSYRLLMDMDAGALMRNSPVFLSLTIMRDVPAWSNFWLATVSIFIYPLYTLLKRWRFEKTRWSESDFPPAIYRILEQEEEDAS